MNRKWLCIALSVVVLFVIGIAATSCGAGDSVTTTTTTVGATATTAAASTDTTGTTSSADTTQATEAVTTTLAAGPGDWVEVAHLEGSDTMQGEVFALSGKPARYSYKVTSTNTATIVAFYVMAEGTSLEKDGAIPEAMVTESGEDSATLTVDAGNYYLMVKSANCDWEFSVEEQQ